MYKKYLTAFSLVLSLVALNACTAVGVATGVAATAGMAAVQEGGVSRAVSDLRIQTEINDLWLKYDFETFSKLDITVNQGRVLLTGVVQDPEKRVEAVRLAWQPKGVKQVINEITVANSSGIVGFARDTWISTRLRGAMTFDKAVQSVNYTIDTVQGVVYLMGVAQNQKELNRVIETARTIPDVKRVVSYVKMVGEPINRQNENTAVINQQTYQEQYQPATIDNDEPGYNAYNGAEYENYPAQSQGYGGRQPESYNANQAPIQLQPVESEPLY